MFATHSGAIEESERKRIIRSIRGDFESVATKIGVKSLIDFNSINNGGAKRPHGLC